jgi:MFS transporter, DHA1 family, multidrug resistance protein
MGQRLLAYGLVWSSFYEQLAWAPVLVILAAGTGDPEITALAASAYSAANLLGNLAFGYLSDRAGRYRVAGAGLLAMAGTAALHLAAGSPGALVGARFLHGLAASTVAPSALAVASDGLPGNRRGETMARVGLVIALASMAAPPLTGGMARGLGLPAAIWTLVVGLALVGGLTLVAAGRMPDVRRWRPVREEAVPDSDDRQLNPALTLVGGAVAFAIMFGQNVLFYALPLQGRQFGMDAADTGRALSAFAVGAFVAFVPPLSRLADRRGRLLPLLAGLGLTAAGLLALVPATTLGAMALALLVYGLGFGLAFPAVTALSADAAGQGRRGLAFGVLTAAFSAGAVVGPLTTRGLSGVMPPFAVAAGVALLGIVAAVPVYRLTRPVSAPPVGPGA